MTICRRFGLLAVAVFASGCGSDSDQAIISGSVLLDGKALPSGVIRFIPSDGLSTTADAPIVEGRFVARVPPGPKRIEISAPKVIGKIKMYSHADSPVVDEVAELIPDRYNVRSELSMTAVRGKQEKQFELSSQ